MPPPKFHGLIAIDSTNNAFRVTGAGGTTTQMIASGDWFIRAHAGGGDPSQMVELADAAIEVNHGAGNVRVAVNDDGFVTIYNDHGATALTLTWTFSAATTAMRNILGFTGASVTIAAGGGSSTGTNQHRYGWYPNVVRNDMEGHPSTTAPLESDAVVTIAPDGTGTTTKYNERSGRRIVIGNVFEDYVHPVGSPLITNRDYRQFWQDILSTGRRFRYYDDRTVNAGPGGTGAPETFFAARETAAGGTWEEKSVKREAADWARLWRVSIEARTFVA